jgi:hypothetical protein
MEFIHASELKGDVHFMTPILALGHNGALKLVNWTGVEFIDAETWQRIPSTLIHQVCPIKIPAVANRSIPEAMETTGYVAKDTVTRVIDSLKKDVKEDAITKGAPAAIMPSLFSLQQPDNTPNHSARASNYQKKKDEGYKNNFNVVEDDPF